MRKRIAVILAMVALFLAGCALKAPDTVLLPADPQGAFASGRTVIVLAATTRARADGSDVGFTTDRAEQLNYQEYVVSIPPGHAKGKIEWPQTATGNPGTDFVVVSTRPLTETQFADSIANQLATDPNKLGDVLVFVHGYNTSLPEAVFRMAEFGADLTPAAGVMVLFTWPSRARLLDYGADRETVAYSRDYLEQTLNGIAAVKQVKEIYLGAHSMGSYTAVEALRQARFKNAPFLRKLGLVGLLAPDIDFDVFRTQLDAIGRLHSPIFVLVSRDDRALATSQLIAGGVYRVGNVLIDDPRKRAAIERYGLEVIDVSQVNSDDPFAHSKYADALSELQSIAAASETGGRRFSPGVFVLDGSGQTVSAPARIRGGR